MEPIKTQAVSSARKSKSLKLQRFSFFRKSTCIVFLSTLAVSTAVVCSYGTHSDDFDDLSHLTQVVKVNPEIKVLTNYMKSRNSKLPIELAELQAKIIVDVATQEALPVELLVGLAETETIPPFNPFSESSVGAAGLMQIYQAPNVVISQDKKFDIRYNAEIGSIILKGKLAASNDNLTKALDMYSGGARDYASRVYECIGRYSMYRSKVVNKNTNVAKN